MAPKATSRKRAASDASDAKYDEAPTTKRSKSSSLEKQTDDEGNVYWEISGRRRLQIQEFQGTMQIAIREFYEKDGKSLPGKKGINMPVEQLAIFVALLPQIEDVLREKGVEVPRPEYGDSKSVARDESGDGGGEEEDGNVELKGEEDEEVKVEKANHEATSDEDEKGE